MTVADSYDGYDSLELGPSVDQQEVVPCEVNGDCYVSDDTVLGPTTVGLIYANLGLCGKQ